MATREKRTYYNAPAPLFAQAILDCNENAWFEIACVSIAKLWQQRYNFSQINAILHFMDSDMAAVNRGSRCIKDYKGKPYMSIEANKYWEYRENIGNKQEKQRVLLLAYLAIKSLIGTRDYAKINNNYLLSRMCGYGKPIPPEKYHPIVQKYSSDYHVRKLKELLKKYYQVQTYSHARGFYASLTKHSSYLHAVAIENRTPHNSQSGVPFPFA